MFDFKKYRNSNKEQLRLSSVLEMLPSSCKNVLEIGCRDCFITLKLAEKYERITALDLTFPQIENEKITPMQGDVTNLLFPNNSFDLVVCTEVLEHIKPEKLEQACNELSRVSKKYLLIGVPYKQDQRAHATQCQHCGTINPTCGHVNTFNETILYSKFPEYLPEKTEFVGSKESKTNCLSYNIYKHFHFPFGTYQQEEPCINCNQSLIKPQLSFLAKIVCYGALGFEVIQNKLLNRSSRPNWVHILFLKQQ
jgi:ubiquinone/menaquinone biosynthesis C-methylase UbiE